MTDHYYALTVVLEKPIRADDAEPIIQAILMIKDVVNVTPQVADWETYAAIESAKHELRQKLWAVLK